jgi:hypothetical protein
MAPRTWKPLTEEYTEELVTLVVEAYHMANRTRTGRRERAINPHKSPKQLIIQQLQYYRMSFNISENRRKRKLFYPDGTKNR